MEAFVCRYTIACLLQPPDSIAQCAEVISDLVVHCSLGKCALHMLRVSISCVRIGDLFPKTASVLPVGLPGLLQGQHLRSNRVLLPPRRHRRRRRAAGLTGACAATPGRRLDQHLQGSEAERMDVKQSRVLQDKVLVPRNAFGVLLKHEPLGDGPVAAVTADAPRLPPSRSPALGVDGQAEVDQGETGPVLGSSVLDEDVARMRVPVVHAA
mmetsp:Transcript_76179/g.240895  ORF Transcript_76179/g.240895 Transcript_76179/m.240895 type:complete len:211 (-) Transcript_76179:122-754(-)